MEMENIEKEWLGIRSSLGDGYEEKLVALFEDEREETVSQCIELLLSFGEAALCAVLEKKERELYLRSEINFAHRDLWEKEIVERVKQQESLWYAQYQKHQFEEMEFCVLGHMDCTILSEGQKDLVKRVSLRMNEIPAGTFTMGAVPNDEETDDNEKPRHKVTLTRSLLVCRYLCTQGLYEAVIGENPSEFEGFTRPVENVSWCDAVLFCNKLSEMEGFEPVYWIPMSLEEACRNQSSFTDETVDGLSKQVQWKKDANGYRLPTEAEWEFCAKAGHKYKYSGSDDMDEVGWYYHNCAYQTHPVGQKKANGFGLYDMSGNVSEWVWDSAIVDEDNNFVGESKYTHVLRVDPIVEKASLSRIRRGGCWNGNASHARVSTRYRIVASYCDGLHGFRFLRTIK